MSNTFGQAHTQHEYFCLKCNHPHYNKEPIYEQHIILHKSKDGIKPHEHKWKLIKDDRNWQKKNWYKCKECGDVEYK